MKGLNEKFVALKEWKTRRPPISETLNMNLDKYDSGIAVLSMAVGSKFHNPMGTVHGGIMTDLADAAMGLATISTLNENESFTTLELKMNFLRPVYEGKIFARANVLHRGRTIAVVESVLTLDETDGKVVARGVATQMILDAERKVSGNDGKK